jgi:hypothetical protein
MLLPSRTTNSHLPQLPCFSSLNLSVHHFYGAQGGSHRILIVPHSTLPQYCKCQHQRNTYPQNDWWLCQLTLFKRYIHRRYYLPISLMNYTIPRPRKEVILWMLGMMALVVSPSPPSYSPPAQALVTSKVYHYQLSCEGNG